MRILQILGMAFFWLLVAVGVGTVALSTWGATHMVFYFQQAIPWWQSAAFGNAMIGLVVAIAGFVAARAQQNHTKIATIEKNTNDTNAKLQDTVAAQGAAILADKDRQIATLKAAQGGTRV
jgi:hypothetical protein